MPPSSVYRTPTSPFEKLRIGQGLLNLMEEKFKGIQKGPALVAKLQIGNERGKLLSIDSPEENWYATF
jgi:hypothetical protein